MFLDPAKCAGKVRLIGAHVTRQLSCSGRRGTSRLYEALRAGEFVLVAPPEQPLPVPGVVIHAVTGQGVSVLVRPDGYVAWAGNAGNTDDGSDGLRAALGRWGAAPTPRAVDAPRWSA